MFRLKSVLFQTVTWFTTTYRCARDIDASLLTRLSNWAQLIGLPVAVASCAFAFLALPPQTASKSAEVVAPTANVASNTQSSDITAQPTMQSKALREESESLPPSPTPVVGRLTVDSTRSHYSQAIKWKVDPKTDIEVEYVDLGLWSPNDKWKDLYHCSIVGKSSKARLAKCGNFSKLNPHLDVLVENLSPTHTVLTAARLVVRKATSIGGGDSSGNPPYPAAIPTSGTFTLHFHPEFEDAENNKKWYVTQTDLLPPIVLRIENPIRLSLELVLPYLEAASEVEIHIEFLTSAGIKAKSKPIRLVLP
jgi:hypothetical protein